MHLFVPNTTSVTKCPHFAVATFLGFFFCPDITVNTHTHGQASSRLCFMAQPCKLMSATRGRVCVLWTGVNVCVCAYLCVCGKSGALSCQRVCDLTVLKFTQILETWPPPHPHHKAVLCDLILVFSWSFNTWISNRRFQEYKTTK